MSKLGFGCMGLTGAYNSPVDDEGGIAVITHAFRRGVTFFDTADEYGGPFTNEILLGKVRPFFSFLFLESSCERERVLLTRGRHRSLHVCRR